MFFQSKKIKHAKALVRQARKILKYRVDIISKEQFDTADHSIKELESAIRSKGDIDAKCNGVEEAFKPIEPPRKDAAWRENCEVFLVAIIIAVGIRAYFLQPFKIPTNSMYPTLNGYKGYTTAVTEAPPNFLVRTAQMLLLTRTYVNETAKADEEVLSLTPSSYGIGGMRFFESTIVETSAGNKYVIPTSVAVVENEFKVREGVHYKAGESIVHGYVEGGDHVFVDKFSYNFVRPKRGDVFVFKTKGIEGLREREGTHYIKRLAGEPGDTLRIDKPKLYINGELAEKWPFQRVMSCENNYHGYFNMLQMKWLSTPQETYTVLDHEYFALGDNSQYSLDSRAWGGVPEMNIVGRGFFVYYPFSKHWSLIR